MSSLDGVTVHSVLVAYQKYCFDNGGDLGAPPLKRIAEGSISQEVSSELPSPLMYGVTQGLLGWHALPSVITWSVVMGNTASAICGSSGAP